MRGHEAMHIEATVCAAKLNTFFTASRFGGNWVVTTEDMKYSCSKTELMYYNNLCIIMEYGAIIPTPKNQQGNESWWAPEPWLFTCYQTVITDHQRRFHWY